jgi:hypothetical protein
MPMRPFPIAAVFACLLTCAMPVRAAGADDGLDLSLPPASTYRNDPPGAFYGDTSGVPAAVATATDGARLVRPACPTTPDGQPSDLTGSVSAGVGYSSRLGNSNFQAATLTWCKSYGGDVGNQGRVNVQLNIGTYDGPGVYPLAPRPGPGPWPGPWSSPGPAPWSSPSGDGFGR